MRAIDRAIANTLAAINDCRSRDWRRQSRRAPQIAKACFSPCGKRRRFIATARRAHFRIDELPRGKWRRPAGLALWARREEYAALRLPRFRRILPNRQSTRAQRSAHQFAGDLPQRCGERRRNQCSPEIGLSVQPKKGNAVYFEYANSLRQVDQKSVHAGAAVHVGGKWIVNAGNGWGERRFLPAVEEH